MKKKVLLLDIDGTLLYGSHPTHLAAFVYGLKKCFGLELRPENVFNDSFHGMTDAQILHLVLANNGIEIEPKLENLKELLDTVGDYFIEHCESVHQAKADHFRHPGALWFMRNTKQGYISCILSGNIEKIARKRIEKAGLTDFVLEYSCGDMAMQRKDLVLIAKQRILKNLGFDIPIEDFVIIGDTVLDVACAKENGIPCVGVATGYYTKEELQFAGADIVIESFVREGHKIFEFLK